MFLVSEAVEPQLPGTGVSECISVGPLGCQSSFTAGHERGGQAGPAVVACCCSVPFEARKK